MMTKIVYIICFTLIALMSPKHTVACSEHQEKAPMAIRKLLIMLTTKKITVPVAIAIVAAL